MSKIVSPEQSPHAHKLVMSVAVGMAKSMYEDMLRDPMFHKAAPNRKAFIKFAAPKLLPQARATLAQMLTSTSLPPVQKEQILDALVLDNTLQRGR